MQHVEPIFVIVDDFSDYPEGHGVSYLDDTLPNVCLYDYGFIDLYDDTGVTNFGDTDYYNISKIEQTVKKEVASQQGVNSDYTELDITVTEEPQATNPYGASGWATQGSFNAPEMGAWSYTASAVSQPTGSFSVWGGDNVSATTPAHGDFVFSQFMNQLNKILKKIYTFC